MSLTATGALMPAMCACCGEPAAQSALVRSRGGSELLVGYCDACQAHVGREEARKLAGGVASGLMGGALGLTLPFAVRPLPLPLVFVLVFFVAFVPIAIVALWPRRAAAGHASEGPSVRFIAEGELLCASDRFATELGRANDGKHRLAKFREQRLVWSLLAVPPLAASLGTAMLAVTSPVVRVVNLSPERIGIEVDGRAVVDVDSTSVESASAGNEIRVSAGRHALVARAPGGRVIESAEVEVHGGRAHLFAPGSEGYCFWLESAEYGRGRSEGARKDPLEGPPHFWVLPSDLGGWFRPVPEQARAEARLTGGTVTVLRQAPCGTDL